MFDKDNVKADAIYNVKSENQSGGITAGKIETVNIFTDKAALGIREPGVLYQNGKRVGDVINFVANESMGTFAIAEIEFDKSLRDTSVVWQPYEYMEYLLRITHINRLVSGVPPGASGVNGLILSKKV